MASKYIHQEKYQEKIGLIAKTYKLNKELVDQFKEACDNANTTQAKQLSIMMQAFIDEIG